MSLRTLAGGTAARFVRSSLGVTLLRPLQHGTLNLFFTHYYGVPRPYLYDAGQDLSIEAFRRNLRRMKRTYSFRTLDSVATELSESSTLDPKAVVLTFDDGLDLEREGVLTLLDDLRIPAVFYLIGSTLDNRNLMWRNQIFAMAKTHPDRFKEEYQRRHGPTENPAAQAMTWPPAKVNEFCSDLWVAVGMPPIGDYLAEHQPYFKENQIRQLMTAGHEVGWHTETHQNCALLTEEEAEEEITKPAEAFRAKYDLKRLSLAYPYGLRYRAGAQDAEWTSQLRNSVGAGSERSDVPRSPDKAPFYAVLGTEGLRPTTAPPHEWERLDIETDLISAVYERPGMEELKRRLGRKP